ncbi:MAG TPA: trehalase-like domain-containing protein, partial [Nitrospirales bacterium]|nr:trehalase-like domain-containing protein [Nitrospirales bacterium]
MAYHPIENYGIIGNMRTAALVGMHGSIDWLCFPHFDSPSIFAAILDDHKGGHFRIVAVNHGTRTKQFYWPDTNILVTRFLSADGVAEMHDFMPAGMGTGSGWHNQIIRRIRVVRGKVTFRLECYPAFDYARARHETTLTTNGAVFESATQSLALATALPLKADDRGVFGEFTLGIGEPAVCALRPIERHAHPDPPPSEDTTQELFEHTVRFWRGWLSQCTYAGRWREMV